jgi:hypothetical protein
VLVREATISTAVAGTLAAILLWAAPPGVDLAAHAYQRGFLIEHGFAIWNNFWYAGRYSFVTYSVLYYPLAALFGIRVLALATIAASALAFTLVVGRKWGPATRFSSRTFAVVWAGVVLSAAFPFALGVALGLLALSALQQGRHRIFGLLVFGTLLASPLAFALLLLVLAGSVLERRPRRATVAVVAAAIALELLLRRLFPSDGRFPFTFSDLSIGVVFSLLGIAVTWKVPRARTLLGLFGTFLIALVVAYAIPSDLGSNVERLKYAAVPVALLAAALAPQRRLLVIPLVCFAIVWNVFTFAHTVESANADPAQQAVYWQPAIGFLRAHLSPSFRVEAVDTADHWAADYLPNAGIPIVRGWYRQSDFPQNELLYDTKLAGSTYDAWLRALGVRYVVLSDSVPDYSARTEATLIRTGRSRLLPVFRSTHVTIYELPHATPIVTGPAQASIVWLWPSRAVLVVDAPGTYRVALRWSPYWGTRQGCVGQGKDGMVRVTATQAGLVDLDFKLSVQRGLQTIAGIKPGGSCGTNG